MKNNAILAFLITGVLLLTYTMTGCGGDDDDIGRLYDELVGEYELMRSIVEYPDGREPLELKPPQATGIMTITSNRTLRQVLEVLGNPVIAEGNFEILQDEEIIEVRHGDITVPLVYTWDGEILTTAVDAGTYFETDYWRKL